MNTCHQTLVRTYLENQGLIRTKAHAKQLHAQVIRTIGPVTATVYSLIISIFSNLNLLKESLTLFDTLDSPKPTKAWKSIIKCYASCGQFVNSLTFFNEMRTLGKIPDRNIFPSVLKSCAYLRDIRLGESLHGSVIRLGFDCDLYTGNALMNMYAKLQNFGGHQLIDVITEPQKPISSSRSEQKKSDHSHECNRDFTVGAVDFNINTKEMNLLGNVGGEKKIGSLGIDGVRKVFEEMPTRDIVSWNTVISGSLQNGRHKEALDMLREMGNADLKPDSFTLSTVLPMFAKFVERKGDSWVCH